MQAKFLAPPSFFCFTTKNQKKLRRKKITLAMPDAHFAVLTVQISLVLNGKYKAMNFSMDIITKIVDEY